MAQRGFPQHSHDEYMMMVGNGVRNLVKRALPEENKEDDRLVDEALKDFKTYYTNHIDEHTHPFAGIEELLEELHKEGMLMAVVSNKFQEGTERLIKKFFPHIPFAAILGNRPGFPLKPDPAIIEEVLRLTGTNKEDALMVGDSQTDMQTARNCGIRAIAVSWGYRPMKSAEGLTVTDTAEELKQKIMN